MISLDCGGSFFRRFVRELEEQAPLDCLANPPRLDGVHPDDIEVGRLVWAGRIVDEYRSVVVFTELLKLLAECEAPFAALCTVQRLIGDELRHARACAQVVEWLGGFDGLSVDLADLALPARDDSKEGRALEIVVRELVVAETESLVMLRACRDATEQPAIRRVLEMLLRDEVRHAAAGQHLSLLLESSLSGTAIAAVQARLPETIESDRAHIREQYMRTLVGGPGRAVGASLNIEDVQWATPRDIG